MILTYPLNTLKTREQARNVHTDVSWLIKNKADKSRTVFILL